MVCRLQNLHRQGSSVDDVQRPICSRAQWQEQFPIDASLSLSQQFDNPFPRVACEGGSLQVVGVLGRQC